MEAENRIEISIAEQRLRLLQGDEVLMDIPVSTAANGPGEQEGSECTPRGRHRIAACIGEGEPVNSVFVGRVPTGEIYSPELKQQSPERDWILTRILWLDGLEEGVNRGGEVDSHSRYIYLHGTPDEVELGKPGSRGCVRVRNADLLELFGLVSVGTDVVITE